MYSANTTIKYIVSIAVFEQKFNRNFIENLKAEPVLSRKIFPFIKRVEFYCQISMSANIDSAISAAPLPAAPSSALMFKAKKYVFPEVST